MDRSSHVPGQEWRGHHLAQVWPTLESRAHQHTTLPPSPPLLASGAPRGGQREPGQQEQKVQAPSPAVPPLRDEAMNSCPFPRMRTCPSSPQFGVCSLHEPHASHHVAAWSWKLGLEETLKNQCATTPFSGGETEAQGGPGPGAGGRLVVSILAERPLASCRLTLPLGAGRRVATAGRAAQEAEPGTVWLETEPHRGVLLLCSLPWSPRAPTGGAPRGAGWGWMGGKPARSALTQPGSACALPAAFPCERCLIISDRVQRRHLFASGESPFRLSITVTDSTFLEAPFPFIMGPGGEGGRRISTDTRHKDPPGALTTSSPSPPRGRSSSRHDRPLWVQTPPVAARAGGHWDI